MAINRRPASRTCTLCTGECWFWYLAACCSELQDVVPSRKYECIFLFVIFNFLFIYWFLLSLLVFVVSLCIDVTWQAPFRCHHLQVYWTVIIACKLYGSCLISYRFCYPCFFLLFLSFISFLHRYSFTHSFVAICTVIVLVINIILSLSCHFEI